MQGVTALEYTRTETAGSLSAPAAMLCWFVLRFTEEFLEGDKHAFGGGYLLIGNRARRSLLPRRHFHYSGDRMQRLLRRSYRKQQKYILLSEPFSCFLPILSSFQKNQAAIRILWVHYQLFGNLCQQPKRKQLKAQNTPQNKKRPSAHAVIRTVAAF